MADLQTILCTSAFHSIFESSLYCGDHSYSSAMNGSRSNMAAPLAGNSSNRSPRRPVNNNAARFGDESDRNASSSDALANGIASSTNSIVSTNSGLVGPASFQKSSIPTSSINPFSVDRSNNSIQEIKKSLTLDFTSPESAKKSLLSTPETISSILGLTSADFDKFITQGFAQSQGLVVQTPTPTQFFFPKNVTSEQEQYARGFLDALNQIYQRSGFIPVTNILSPGFVVNTVAQEAKEGGKEQTGQSSNSNSSAFPGPSTSSVSLNAAVLSNLLAAISTPTLPASAVPEPAFITTVSTSGAQQIRQSLAAAAASQQHPNNFYAINARNVSFPTSASTVVNNLSSAITSSASGNSNAATLKVEPIGDGCTPSPATYEESSRSSSVTSSYRDQHSNFGAGSDAAAAAAALATMNRSGHHHQYGQNFPSGASFMQPSNQQFLALTNAAQLLIGGQPDHNLSSTASASSTASSVSGASMKMEICDDQGLPERFLPGTIPLNPEEQEKLKLERKRARNRQAATKCRKRKIERIQTLEQEVAVLEEQNKNLEDRREGLLEELQELRSRVEEHVKAKCNIIVPSQLSAPSTSSHFTGTLLNGTK